MLSALIPSEHSYRALPRAGQLVHQRFVHSGPLVLGATSLKHQRLRQIETNLSHAFVRFAHNTMQIYKCMSLG